MFRCTHRFAALALALLWLPAPARAIDVTWQLENLTRGGSGTTLVAENGDVIRARIFMDATVAGVLGYSFALVWDESLDDELELLSFSNTPPPPLMEVSPPIITESTPTQPGLLAAFHGVSLLGPFFVGFAQVGEVDFRVDRVSPDGVDLRLFERPGIDFFQDGFGNPVVVALPDATIDGQAECDDTLDNDGDGLADFSGGDPGCTGSIDGSERQFGVICDDGEDNDGDGLTDFPDDPECASPGDVSEAVLPPSPVPGPAPLLLVALAALLLGTARCARPGGRG